MQRFKQKKETKTEVKIRVGLLKLMEYCKAEGFINKYTEFAKIGDGIFQNSDDENHYFFEVPRLINFDEFLAGMEKIKNNCNYHLFDSFLTSIFLKDYTQDFIGIYSEHCDKSRFDELAKEIKKVFHV